MDLLLNFVWIGPGELPAVGIFNIKSWLSYGATVHVYAHSCRGEPHTARSLGLGPYECGIFDIGEALSRPGSLPGEDDLEQRGFLPLLRVWLGTPMKPWAGGGQELTYNLGDLTKAILAMTRQGVSLDLKIGPTPIVEEFVAKGAFARYFVTFIRKGVIENQRLGTMEGGDRLRGTYRTKVFTKSTSDDLRSMASAPYAPHYNDITRWHNSSFLGPMRLLWLDIHKYGKARHLSQLQIPETRNTFAGIAEKTHGPLRIFKKENDQANASSGDRTTTKNITDAMAIAMREMRAWNSHKLGEVQLHMARLVPLPEEPEDW